MAFTGDTLAANLVGGFKEGVGFVYKICRTCEITSSQSKWILFHNDCSIRQADEHVRRCKRLETCLTNKARQYWSRVYGINSTSTLLSIDGFLVTEGLVHDPMHLLFEGVTPLELKLLLRHLIGQQFFTLSYFNCAIAALSELVPCNCRPNTIEWKQIQSPDKLKQTAHQIWWLSHMTPLAVGDNVPEGDTNWLSFLRLLQIQQLCTSPVATNSTSVSLEIVVACHNQQFCTLYPESSSIKLHYLLHLPAQIRKFGPARNQWCMRMEAKNSFFKRKKLRNTKNVSRSLAYDHQRWLCCMQRDNTGCPNARFLHNIRLTSTADI